MRERDRSFYDWLERAGTVVAAHVALVAEVEEKATVVSGELAEWNQLMADLESVEKRLANMRWIGAVGVHVCIPD